MKSSRRQRRTGFIMTDLVIGLGLVTIVGLLLAGAVGRSGATEQRLADQRAAVRVAEHAMLNLQRHQPLPQLGGDVRIATRAVDGADAPAGFSWTAVDATVRGRRATLVGLVPADTGGSKP
jgi:hypothetical protein